MRTRFAVGLLFVCAMLRLTAQQSPPASPASDAPPPARFGAATSGVVVDVVVRDKRGLPVRDLAQSEFEVYEDGVRQEIVAFEPYSRSAASATVEAAAAAAGLLKDPAARGLAEGPPVIAIAWDRLGPEGRALAHRAARRLVVTRQPGELVGVFLTDMTLQTIVPYTTDGEKLAAAVGSLAARATSSLDREPNGLDSIAGRAETPPTASAADSGYGLAGFPQPPSTSSRGERPDGGAQAGGWAGLLHMLQRMERTYKQALYEMQGRASIAGLLALVDSLGELPGRKTLLYFCEGLTIPDSQQARFRAVIDTANRHNVSVYTFDSAGLRVHSAQQQTAREIRELTFGALGSSASRSEKWNEELEQNERLLKMDPAVSLGILAKETGGLLINNTNALDRGVDRINEDRRHHYLLSYVSSNPALDNTYRKIEVRVNRPDVEVRARRGYRAAPTRTAAPVLEYETAALAALSASPPPMHVPIAVRALSTPLPGHPGLTSMVVGFNARSLAYATDKEGRTYLAEATVLVRVTDSAQRELARVSQQYHFAGEMEKREASTASDVLFFRTPDLPPGRHVAEAVAHDGIAEKSTVLRVPVTIPQPSQALLAGDLFVVSRVEAFPADQAGAAPHPLAWKGMLLYPSFGEPVDRSSLPALTFALPAVVRGEAPDATLELLAAGRTLATLPLPVEAPEADGRLMVVGRLPLAQIPPGSYEIRATLVHGGERAVRTVAFTIAR